MSNIFVVDGQSDAILDMIPEMHILTNNHHKSMQDNVETFEFETHADMRFSKYLGKRNRIVIPDEDGFPIEFIITESSRDESKIAEVFATASYQELVKAKRIKAHKTTAMTAEGHANAALSGTEWEPGTITFKGVRTLTFDKTTEPFSYLKRIASEFDLELNFRVENEGNRITRRYVDLVERVGGWHGRTVEYGKDLIGLRRVEKQDVVTAMVGIGPEREDGTRLEVFVEDTDALSRWGRKGNHLIEEYEPESEDENMTLQRLTTLTENALEKRVNMNVSYEGQIADLEHTPGMGNKKMRYGDTIRIKDTGYNPPLYVEARLHDVDRDIVDESAKEVVLGDFIEYTEEEVLAIWKTLQKEIQEKFRLANIRAGFGDIKFTIYGYLEPLKAEKASNDSQFSSLFNNQDLDPVVKGFLNTAKGGYDNAFTILNNTINSLSSKAEPTETDLDLVKNQYSNYQMELSILTSNFEIATDDIAKNKAENTVSPVKKSLDAAQKEIDTAKVDIEKGKKDLEDANIRIDTSVREIEDANTRLADAQVQLGELDKEMTSASTRIQDAQNRLATADTDIKEANNRITKAETAISTLQTNLGTAQGDIEQAISDLGTAQTQLENAQGDINKANTNISNLEDALSDKADESYVNNRLQNKVDTSAYNTKINELVNNIADKAGLEYVDGQLRSKVDTSAYTTKINQLTSDIADKVNGEWVDGQLRVAIDDLEIGGRNLLRQVDYSETTTYQIVKKTNETMFGQPIYEGIKITTGTPPVQFGEIFEIKKGETFTASLYVKQEIQSASTNARFIFYDRDRNRVLSTISVSKFNEWERLILTFKNKEEFNLEKVAVYFYLAKDPEEITYFSCPQLEQGNKATNFQLSPEDIFADIDLKADADNVYTISEIDGKFENTVAYTAYQTDQQGIVKRFDSVETRITQTETDISSTVKRTEFEALEDDLGNVGQRVTKAETNISQNTTAINQRVTTTTFNSLKNRVDTAETNISQNATAIGLKANQTSVNQITGQISDINASLELQAGQISSKVDATYVKNEVNGVGRWTKQYKVNTANPLTLTESNGDSLNDLYSYEVVGKTIGTGTNTTAIAVFKSNKAGTSNGEGWTLEKLYEMGSESSNYPEFFIDENGKPSIGLYGHTSFYTVEITHVKTIGRNTPSTVLNNEIIKQGTAIDQNATEIGLRATKTEFNALTGRVNTAEGKITTMAGKIDLKVDIDGIISSINLSKESVNILGKHITLDGNTLVTGTIGASAATFVDMTTKNMTANNATIKDSTITGTLTTNAAIFKKGTFEEITIKNATIQSATISGAFGASGATFTSATMNSMTANSATIANSTITGTLTATGASITKGTFNDITANRATIATATISGTITATNATFAKGTFNDITANRATIANSTITGTLTAANATITKGTFNSATINNATIKDATITGTLNSAKGTFAGSLSGVDGTFTGQLNGATGTFSGTISAGKISSSTTIDISSNIYVGNNIYLSKDDLTESTKTINFHDGLTEIWSSLVRPGGKNSAAEGIMRLKANNSIILDAPALNLFGDEINFSTGTSIDNAGGIARWRQSSYNYIRQDADGSVYFYQNGSNNYNFTTSAMTINKTLNVNAINMNHSSSGWTVHTIESTTAGYDPRIDLKSVNGQWQIRNDDSISNVLSFRVGANVVDERLRLTQDGDLTLKGSLQKRAHAFLSLANGWANYGGNFQSARYSKSGDNFVHLSGLVRNGTIGGVIGTLPAGCRPANVEIFAVATYSGDGKIYVYPDGRVLANSGSTSYMSLSGINFNAEN